MAFIGRIEKMKMMRTKILLLPIILLLFACEKDNTKMISTKSEINEPEIPVSEFKDADATLQATYYSCLRDSNLIGTITDFKGYGKAVFRNQSRQLDHPRRVRVEGTNLADDNGRFTNYPGKTPGIDFGSKVKWEITGLGSRIPTFHDDVMYKVPEIGDVNVKDSIFLEKELVMHIDDENPFTNLGNRIDSLKFTIYGPNTVISKKMPGNDAVLFKTSEVNGLGEGTGYIQVEAYSVDFKDYDGYRVAFVNKGVFHKKVTLHY